MDSSTDISNRDLEIVYLRFVSSGLPINMFLGVEELESADAVGHRVTIESRTYCNFFYRINSCTLQSNLCF